MNSGQSVVLEYAYAVAANPGLVFDYGDSYLGLSGMPQYSRIDNYRWAAYLVPRAELRLSSRASLFGSYDLSFNQSQSLHTGNGGLEVTW